MNTDACQSAGALSLPPVLALRVALLSVGYSLDGAAVALGRSPRGLQAVLRAERRPPQALLSELRNLMGPERWAWACGETDRLPSPQPRAAAPATLAQRAA